MKGKRNTPQEIIAELGEAEVRDSTLGLRQGSYNLLVTSIVIYMKVPSKTVRTEAKAVNSRRRFGRS